MQRTVREYNFTFVRNYKENNQIKAEPIEILVREFDEKKAIKKAQKQLNSKSMPLEIKFKDVLYFMDDETFFNYATRMTNN